MNARRSQPARRALAPTLCAALLLAGCVTEQSTPSTSVPSGGPSRTSTANARPDQAPAVDLPDNLGLQPGGQSLNIDVRAAIAPLGHVPYDNFSLPLVSPDGRFLATEAGIAPTWEMALAEPGAQAPGATHVDVFRLDLRTSIPEQQRQPPQRVAVVSEPVLLGRSSSVDGFLVEAPRDDGARWIGLASWQTGEIRWLVQDEHVNAFASLGPDGRLAWCRRRLGQEHFELVVRRHGEEFVMTSPDEDWLMPHWSGRGDGIFAFPLREGHLDLAHMIASSKEALRQSMRLTPVAVGANVYIAYQTMTATVTTLGLPQPRFDQVAFVNPAHSRAAVWRPFSAAGSAPVMLVPRSIAAVPDETDIAYVVTETDLMRQSLDDTRLKAKLLAGPLVPRRIMAPDWHSIVMRPGDGRIDLMAVRLLPPEVEPPATE